MTTPMTMTMMMMMMVTITTRGRMEVGSRLGSRIGVCTLVVPNLLHQLLLIELGQVDLTIVIGKLAFEVKLEVIGVG